jgi:hypothetical protein
MNNKNTKKEIECFYLEKFLAATGWNVHIISAGQDDGYDPDFFINLDGGEVGVEMEKLFKDIKRPSGNENIMALKKGFYDNRIIRPGEYFQLKDERDFSKNWMKKVTPRKSNKRTSNAKTSESLHEKFLKLLSEEYYKIGGCPIMLTLLFKNPNEFQINNSIAKFVSIIKERASSLSHNGEVEFELDEEIKAWIDRLPDNDKFKKYDRWKVVNDSVGFSKRIKAEMLEDLLLPKYEKLEKYRKRVKRVIVLLYANLYKNSGFMRLEGQLPKVKLGGFEAIYLYLHGDSPKSSYWSIGH